MSPVRYELGSYIAEDDVLHCQCRENLKSYIPSIIFTCTLQMEAVCRSETLIAANQTARWPQSPSTSMWKLHVAFFTSHGLLSAKNLTMSP
jgi:hypothetical protein